MRIDLSKYTEIPKFPFQEELVTEWRTLATNRIELTERRLRRIVKSGEGIAADVCHLLHAVQVPGVGERTAIHLVEDGLDIVLVLPGDNQAKKPELRLYSKEESPDKRHLYRLMDNVYLHLHAEFGGLLHR